jgi:exodeoxyribonuclease V gamma subunit
MTKLKLFTSNRLESLAETLAEVIRTPLSSPMDEEIIVVQSKGMKRWVSMRIAQHNGIFANYRFPFPNDFIHEIFQKVIPDLPEHSPFDPHIMTWRIMKLLPSFIARPDFESIRFYLRDIKSGLKCYQLSERIADTFDQYLLFRPEMIFRWEKGEEDNWQAILWRELVRGDEKRHQAMLGKTFFETLGTSSVELKDLPERISVFGISALPRFHMEVFAAISGFTKVNLFLVNPSKEYWGDILPEKEIQRIPAKKNAQNITPLYFHLKKGNSLLTSMGRMGSNFFDLVNGFHCEEFSSFKDPGEDNLLSCIQSDILNLRDRKQKFDNKKIVAENDKSIQVHFCHSPMREIEVLHDQLIEMFEKDPNLVPRDIIVMTTDIETYAPYIQAIFDIPIDDPRRIAFSIADRNIRKESEIIDAFLAILDLWGGRFGSSQVIAILESQEIQRKFGLSESDIDLVRRWVKDTRIRWGIDGQSRSQLGLPSFHENTWKAGLERLLLGYAMPGQNEKMFGNILPYDHIEGGEVSVLGRLLEFTDQLFTHVASLKKPRTLNEWSETLIELLESFFMPDKNSEREIQVIRRVINNLDDIQKISAFNEDIDINVIKWHLAHYLENEGFGFGFITGGVTFCAMLPMRSIPFKIICLVGMNGSDYPRQSKSLSFDLITKYPKPGDRSRRNDDRYLFLEAILSAREKLYISHVGQSIQDNSIIPPSVLVSELMDYIEEGFYIPGDDILNHITTKHRLQAFSPEYFRKNKRLFSYKEENLKVAQCFLGTRKLPVPFISKELSHPEEKWKTVSLYDLCRFFGNPAKFLLNKRLGVYLEESTLVLEEREAFNVKRLEKYLLETNLVEKRFRGYDLKDFLPLIRASGQLPHGTIGECIYENISQRVVSFVEKTERYMQGNSLEPLEVDFKISCFRLKGRIDSLYPERLMQYRYAQVKSKDRFFVWIHHLILNNIIADSYPRTSILVGLNSQGGEPEWAAWEFPPLENSKEILVDLLEKYWMGMKKPLKFFPESSWTYAHMSLEKNKPYKDAMQSACTTWTGTDYKSVRGECEDAYYQLCFGETNPLDLEFQNISKEVFGPFLKYQKVI